MGTSEGVGNILKTSTCSFMPGYAHGGKKNQLSPLGWPGGGLQSGGSLRCVLGKNDYEFPCCGLESWKCGSDINTIPDHSKEIRSHFFENKPKRASTLQASTGPSKWIKWIFF